MSGREQHQRGVERIWTNEDREAQLADLKSLCLRLADMFAAHGDSRAAELFRVRAVTAGRLLAQGWTQSDLNELGGQFPDGVWWLNPEAVDYGASGEPWQEEAATLHQLARATAMDLRATATTSQQ